MTEAFDRTEYLLRFFHPERVLPPLPGVHRGIAAQLLGMDKDEYDARIAALDVARSRIADDLLADTKVVSSLARVPFSTDQLIVGLGDSLTDDFCSWFELLRLIFERHAPERRVRFLNAGVSGYTTTQLLARLPSITAARPDWVICFAGANDTCRFGAAVADPLTPIPQTIRNLQILRDGIVQETAAQWLWVTPVGVDEVIANPHPFWRALQAHWSARDVNTLAGEISALPGLVADLRGLFGENMDPKFLGADGLHPTLAGQARIATAIITSLAE